MAENGGPERGGGKRATRLWLVGGGGAFVLVALGVGAWLYLRRPAPKKLTPMTRMEFPKLVNADALAGLSADARGGRLAECGYRMGLVSNDDLAKFVVDVSYWKSFFALTQSDRMNFMMGMMSSRLKEDLPWVKKVLAAPPDQQDAMIDRELDRMMWINAFGKGLGRMGLVPKPAEQQQMIREHFHQAGRNGRKQFYREVLNMTHSKDRAVIQEYRRCLIRRGRARGMDFERLERGD